MRLRPAFLTLLIAIAPSVQSLQAQSGLVLDPAINFDVLDPAAVYVWDALPLADGDVLVAGRFLYVNGQARERLVRLNADGSVDTGFGPVEIDGSVLVLAPGTGGTIYVAGAFTVVDGVPRASLARLANDGSLDPTFVPAIAVGTGMVRKLLRTTDGGVYVIQSIPDGTGQATLRIDRLTGAGASAPGFTRIELPGAFLQDAARGANDSLIVISVVNGTNTFADMVKRYRGDGVFDATFQPSAQISFSPRTALVLDDNSVILGGSPGNGYGPGLVRLLATGAQDTTFSGVSPTPFFNVQEIVALSGGGLVVATNGLINAPPPTFMRFSLSGEFDGTFANEGALLPQYSSVQIRALADGGFLALGSFEGIGGQPIARLAQFNASGTLHDAVRTGLVGRGAIERLVPFGGGTMLVGGSFASFGEHERGNVVRLRPDDSIDVAFPETEGPVMDIVIGADGRAVVLGAFPAVSGSTTAGIFRVNDSNVVDATLLAGFSTDANGFAAGTAFADGSFVIAGALPYYVPSLVGIMKILPDGSRDADFGLNSADTSKGPLCVVTDVAADASNRLLLTGADFSGSMSIQGVTLPGVARVSPIGQLDPTFTPTVGLTQNSSDLTPLPNGDFFVIGGRGDQGPNGYPTLLRFHGDGALDGAFNLAITDDEFPAGYVITPDNALLVSLFDRSTGTGMVRRFTMAGAVDPSFSISTGRDGAVTALAFDDLGRLWLAGSFSEIEGQRRIGIARFAPPGVFVAIEGPSQVVVVAGGGHTLTTTSSGTSGSATWQWQRNGSPLAGATATSLAITNFDATKAGTYTVTVTDGGISRTSNSVSIVLPVAPVIATQPATQNGSVGGALVLRVAASGLPPPTYQWYKNDAAIAGATSAELRLRNLTAADAGSYTVRVSNTGGSVTSNAAVVTIVSIGLDSGFAAPALETPQYGAPRTAAGRADSSFLIGVYQGIAINGVPAIEPRLVRMRADGSVDPAYSSEATAGWVPQWVLPDGTGFISRDERSPRDNFVRYYLRRISPDGVMDPSFGPEFEYSGYGPSSLGVLGDGRVMIGGAFPTVDGVARPGLARLLANGTLDTTFQAAGVVAVSALSVRPDGTTIAIVQEGNERIVKRFLATGDPDPSFAPAMLGGGIDYYAGYMLHERTDGSVLIAGTFSTVNGVDRRHVAMLNSDGTLASAFTGLAQKLYSVLDVGIADDGSVRLFGHAESYGNPYMYYRFSPAGLLETEREVAIALVPASTTYEIGYDFLPDGSLILIGRVEGVDGHPVRGIARLNPSGNFVDDFRGTLGTTSYVWNAAPLDNGRWMVAGWFDAIGAVPAPGLAVLGPEGKVDSNFAPELPDGTQVAGAVALAGGRILLSAYLPPFGYNNIPQTILLGPDGARDHSHDAFLHGPATLHAVAADGKMFYSEPNPVVNGISTTTLRRHLPDFSVDPAFAPVTVGHVDGVRPLSDGGAYVLCRLNDIVDNLGTTRQDLCRLTPAGLIDTTFIAPTLNNQYDVLPREAPDGKCIIAGSFAQVNGVPRAAVARLNADGSVDPTFVPPATGLQQYPELYEFQVEEGGGVIVWGRYTARTPVDPNEYVITRLNADGSLDGGLNYVINTFGSSQINHLEQRENGDILVVGRFSQLGDTPAYSIARITSNRFQANAVRETVAIPEGGTGYLEVRLTGPVALPRYWWTKDGQPVPNGDRAALALEHFSAADEGTYRVEVSSADGSLVRSEPIAVSLSTETVAAAQTPLVFSETGGLGGVRVDAPLGTPWSVTDVPSWMTMVAGPLATGSRTVSFNLQPNLSGAERSATITIAGRSFDVRQRASSGRLINISTRGRVGVGDDVLIVGIVTAGTHPLDFLGRGVGPTLATFGVGGVLPDPAIDLKRGQTDVAANDDWDAGADRDEVLAESRRLFAFDLADGQGDAAMLTNLAPGSYTARVYDPAGGQGVALAEFYDRTPEAAMNPYVRAINISTRGRVGVGDDVLIAGFVISGSVPKQVLIRGVGPGLAQFGILDFLRDPIVRVVRDGQIVTENDDWAFSAQADLVATAFSDSQAFPLDPQSRDSALVVTLEPGAYTAILSGADGGEGVAIVEVYDLE